MSEPLEESSIKYRNQIENEEDISRIHKPMITVDNENTVKDYDLINDILGDIVEVKIENQIAYNIDRTMISWFARWRGMDQMYIDMIEKPDWLHKVMDFMAASNIELIKNLESSNSLNLNSSDMYNGTGGFGYTRDLPMKNHDGKVRIKDLWGWSEGQDFAGVSPEMFDESLLTYQKKTLEGFGLVYYGCCEDISKRFDYIFKIPNLRRISVSPFTDLQIASDRIGEKYVFAWKPNSTYIAMEEFDGPLVKKRMSEVYKIIKDNIVDISLKDLITVRNKPERLNKWVEIMRDVIEKF